MNDWKCGSHHKYLLQYHLILVCKYRKKFLRCPHVNEKIKLYSYEIATKHNVIIHEIESDKDHIHYMIETRPNINLSDFVRTLKSYTTYHIQQDFYFADLWGKNSKTFWSD